MEEISLELPEKIKQNMEETAERGHLVIRCEQSEQKI